MSEAVAITAMLQLFLVAMARDERIQALSRRHFLPLGMAAMGMTFAAMTLVPH